MKLSKMFGRVLICMFSSLALHATKMDEQRALSVCGRDSHGDWVIKVIDRRVMPLKVFISRSFWESNRVVMANRRMHMREKRAKLCVAGLSPEERAVIQTIVKNYFDDEESDLRRATQEIKKTLGVDTVAQSHQ